MSASECCFRCNRIVTKQTPSPGGGRNLLRGDVLPEEPYQGLVLPDGDWLTVEGLERSLLSAEGTPVGFSMDVAWGIEPGAAAVCCSRFGTLLTGWQLLSYL